MAWTAPSTVVASQLMTAAFWNQQIRDNSLYLYGLQQGLPLPYMFGGLAATAITNTSYPNGPALSAMIPNTGLLLMDSAILPTGTYQLEGMLANNSGGTTTVGLFDLVQAQNTAMVEITSNLSAGERKISSAITFITGNRNYGVKAKVSSGTGSAYGIRLYRTA